MTRDLNILIISPHYRLLFKELSEEIAKHIKKITIMIHYNVLIGLLRYVPFGGIFDSIRKRYTIEKLLDLKGKPENIDIQLLSMLYYVRDGKNKALGDKIVKKAEKLTQKEGIKFDLIHAHFTYPQGYAAVKLGQKYNVPVVITVHENRGWLLNEYNSGNDRIYWTWKNADALIRVNQKDVSLLKEFNENVFYVPNGFNPRKFFTMNQSKARELLKVPKDRKIIFTFSALIERKGFQYLIDSMNEIIKVRKDILCFIGGSGPMRLKLESQIQNLGLQDYIKLIGYVPDDTISDWLNAADLFVLPSLSESFGVVLIEAMACGKPVVATINGGSEEIIISEEHGLLCDPANPKDLAKKILIALEKKWDEDKILSYVNRFSLGKMANETIRIYRGLL